MARASFWQQLKALLKRNLLLKRRNRQQTIQEFLMPIYFILILAGVKALTAPKVQPSINETTAYKFNDSRLAINTSKILYISPQNANTDEVASRLALQLGLTSGPGYKSFPTAADSEASYRSNNQAVLAGIDFSGMPPQDMNYTIRVPSEAVASTTKLWVGPSQCRNRDGIDHSLGGCAANTYLATFSKIQLLLDTILIQMRASSLNVTAPVFSGQLMPKGEYKSDTTAFQIISSIYFVLAYSPFISFLTVNLLYEKEKKIKEAMRMMGMRDSAFWLSWGLIYTVIIILITAVVVLIAFAVTFFSNSNFFIFYLMLTLYGLTIVNMSFMFTPFFSRAETGGALASLATILLSLLYFVVFFTKDPITQEPTIPVPAIFALCLLSPFTLALAVDQAVALDIRGGGMNFTTINQGVFPLSWMLIMLAVDVVLYGLLAFYLDNVLPNDHGLRRPPWFFLMPSYWCPRKAVPSDEVSLVNGGFGNTDHPTAQLDTDHVEAIPQAFRNKVVLRTYNIAKTFKKDKKEIKAVRGITLDICEGQITALLGHNGAGKTTLIHMLTGMSPPTEGSATIYGLDVSDSAEMTELRTMIGLCPQHNILFDDLSVREQLDFYANLKGVDPHKIPGEVTEAFNMVDLKDQADTVSKQLSGGQKRKLCVAIALIGNPKVVFLDEPTAGMDPSSRRHLWKLLKQQQKDKLILLTTHFMDEADILADRKAIISKGKLQTVGSSLFLKNRFGIGYHLNTVLEPSADIPVITDFIKGHVPDAEVHRHHGKELTFVLPIAAVNTFPELFGSLEEKVEGGVEKSAQLGIHSYGISMTSLEEVFLKLGVEAEAEEEEEERRKNAKDKTPINGDPGHINYGTTVAMDNNGTSSVEIRPGSPDLSTLITGSELTKQRIMALMKLKLFLVLKNPGKFFLSIIFPLIYAIGASAMLKFIPTPQPPTPISLQIQPSMYVNTSVNRQMPNMVINTTDAGSGPAVSSFVQGIESQSIVLQDFSTVAGLAPTTHFLGLFVTDVSSTSQVVSSEMTIVYNDSAVHSIPATINAVSTALLNMTGVLQTIATYSKPWPWLSNVQTGFNGGIFASSLFYGIAIAIIPSTFAIQMVIDREIKAKSQLRLAGIKMNMYWGTTFVFDAIQYYAVCLCMLFVILAFQIPSLTTGGAILCIIMVFIVYVPSNMLANYNISYLFDKYTTAGSTIPNMASWISMIPFMIVSITDMTGQQDAATAMHYVFSFIMPPYAVIGAFYYIDKLYRGALIFQGANPELPLSEYFKFSSNIPVTMIAPIIQIILLYFLLRLSDVRSNGGQWGDCMNCGGKQSSVGAVPTNNDDIPDDEDGDVTKERERVKESENNPNDQTNPVVRVKNLRKEFNKDQKKGCCERRTAADKTRVAVRNSTFMVEPGEVLGILGPNGAGKTTTLNMVIAEMGPTRGKVEVAGHDIRSNRSAAFQGMGYCPQHDAVWDYITLRHHLECYAAIRGIPGDMIKSVSDYFMESLDIKEHADKIAKNLSGGTKRKLSYIISMLGDPKVVLMDEPSTGMDPKSKRFLWDTISAAFDNNHRGALLTTHYMDEADALCSRVAIMINGQIECIGSTQHLKNKFGGGYHLEVKLQGSETAAETMEALHRYVEAAFPGVVRQEAFGDRALYSVPQANIISLSDTFNKLEQCKAELAVEEYSFSQATLEQVFLEFAKNQLDEGEHADQGADLRTASNTRSLHRQLSVKQNAAMA